MAMNPAIFRAYDIRGIFGEDFDAAFAERLGNTVARWLNQEKPILVGRDSRPSGNGLSKAIVAGATSAGAYVIDIGIVSSPQLYWATRALDAAGSIMVTASHNPDEYNGFKVVARRGDVLEVVGGHHLRQIFDTKNSASTGEGTFEHRDVIPDYADAIAYAAKWRGGTELPFSIDAPQPVRRILERLGPIAPDHTRAARFDSDGDRIMFYENGEEIPADFIFLLLVEQLHLQPVVFDLRFSRTVRDRLDTEEIPYFISRAGRLYITLAMRHAGAALGGEISGHYYWREFNGMEAPELTLLRVYAILQKTGQTLSELIAPYRTMAKGEEISIPIRDQKHGAAIIHMLVEHFKDTKQRREDGLTVEYRDWWFNIRPSNTEPVLRLVVEAKTPELLSAETHRLLDLIKIGASA